MRRRRARVRDALYKSHAISAKAAAFRADKANTVSFTESPPTHDANACPAVVIGPYTLGVVRHSSGAPITGSRGTSAAVVVYGSWPVTAIRPYDA
ncbi:hypothetical protein GCM10010182_07920 [Actinomadura cremea]|nr:hypothetical protein GCM10010182_07920 [Actinomadura cremea]